MDILSPRDCSLCVFVCAFVYPYLITNVPIDTEAQFKCIGLLSVFIKGSDSIQGLAEDHAMISRLPGFLQQPFPTPQKFLFPRLWDPHGIIARWIMRETREKSLSFFFFICKNPLSQEGEIQPSSLFLLQSLTCVAVIPVKSCNTGNRHS